MVKRWLKNQQHLTLKYGGSTFLYGFEVIRIQMMTASEDFSKWKLNWIYRWPSIP